MSATAEKIPSMYCQCGCGQKTRISPKSNTEKGWVRGQPRKFLHGHHLRTPERQAWLRSAERGAKISKAKKGVPCPSASHPGASNPRWKGEDVGYASVHSKRLPAARGLVSDYSCVICGVQAQEWALNHSAEKENIRYRKHAGIVKPISLDPFDYDPLCVACHRKADRSGGYGSVD